MKSVKYYIICCLFLLGYLSIFTYLPLNALALEDKDESVSKSQTSNDTSIDERVMRAIKEAEKKSRPSEDTSIDGLVKRALEVGITEERLKEFLNKLIQEAEAENKAITKEDVKKGSP